MSLYKRILVAVDGSSCSNKAVKLTVDMCGQFGAEMHTIFVISEIVVDNFKRLGKLESKEVIEKLKGEGRKYFRDAKEQAKEADVKVVEVLKAGFPADEIVTYAKKSKVDLIVMGTHGKRGATRPLIGSVADRVIHLAPCPVMVVR
ncbi:MAG: universal stress protein [Deltaproteobacteria bacterium]|uniref:Universal stress protein n=1 Tax=Candidatus Zymogenus saltonus TaxID=2844893 RepID=A0A9D8KDH8_9DELT|nr:universal stress protein [Candidatus Zymogenus saltonus]